MADFISYVDYDDAKPSVAAMIGHRPQRPSSSKQQPSNEFPLFDGEITVYSCDDVAFQMQFEEVQQGQITCSNVRLRFTPKVPRKETLPRRSRLIDDFGDIQICAIMHIYVSLVKYNPNPKEKKKFTMMESQLSCMEIMSAIRFVLKDFRVVTIDLQRSQNGTHLANQVLLFSRSTSLEMMVQLGVGVVGKGANVKMPFNSLDSWNKELQRCGQIVGDGAPWRVCGLQREGFPPICQGYPMYVVVPAFFAHNDIDRFVRNWKLGRFPVWVWSRVSGKSSLLISSEPENNAATHDLVNKVLESVSRCHARDDRPFSLHLESDFLQRVGKAYSSLLRFCALDAVDELRARGKNWNSRLHKTGWVHLVRECLSRTSEAMKLLIDSDRSVILFEEGGQDSAILIASLLQICCDPYFRSLLGMQTLVEKMWVAMGHPFGSRLYGRQDATTHNANRVEPESHIFPTWLLFLDCVSQLIHFYPIQFEYSAHLLIALWDASLTGFVPALTCNDVEEQMTMRVGGGVFPLETYFFEAYTMLFGSPYNDAVMVLDAYSRKKSLALTPLQCDVIRPPTTMCDIRLWSACYERWIPRANLNEGGELSEMIALEKAMQRLAQKTGAVEWKSQLTNLTAYSSAYPYSTPPVYTVDDFDSMSDTRDETPRFGDFDTSSVSSLPGSGNNFSLTERRSTFEDSEDGPSRRDSVRSFLHKMSFNALNRRSTITDPMGPPSHASSSQSNEIPVPVPAPRTVRPEKPLPPPRPPGLTLERFNERSESAKRSPGDTNIVVRL